MIELTPALREMLIDAAYQLLVAVLCGFMLGVERQRKDKPAGLRTLTLITIGSALYMIVGRLLAESIHGSGQAGMLDPSRIAAQVVTGIGFLGAGSIMRSHGDIHGLTTAAVIWVAAGIGLTAGIGLPWLAIGVTIGAVCLLTVLDPLATWLQRRGVRQTLELVAPDDSLALARVEQILAQYNIRRHEYRIEPFADREVRIVIDYSVSSNETTVHLFDTLAHISGVRGVSRYN